MICFPPCPPPPSLCFANTYQEFQCQTPYVKTNWFGYWLSLSLTVSRPPAPFFFFSIFIPKWRSAAYDDRLLQSFGNSEQVQSSRILSVCLITIVATQTANKLVFWHRKHNVYIRCAVLLAIEVIIVILASILPVLSVPFVYESRVDGLKAEDYVGGEVPPPDGHLVSTSWLADQARQLRNLALAGLGWQIVTVALWTVGIPRRYRRSNKHRPAPPGRCAQRRKGLSSRAEQAQLNMQTSGPLEQLFHQHERVWRAERGKTREDKVNHRRTVLLA